MAKTKTFKGSNRPIATSVGTQGMGRTVIANNNRRIEESAFMAEKPEKKAAPEKAPQPPVDPQQQPEQARAAVQIEDAQAMTSYANFCRVTGTPEELIIDVGLNSQPVVFHISSDNLAPAQALFEQLEYLLQEYAYNNRPIRVEVVANNQGLL